jgi:aspartate 1-decarboxylase
MYARTFLKGKIHRATVTEANLDYVGSITLDPVLMQAADILENEQVHVVNVNNGERLITYAIPGKSGSGVICLNGAAAHKAKVGDKVIIMSYVTTDSNTVIPSVVFVDDDNQIKSIDDHESAGKIAVI